MQNAEQKTALIAMSGGVDSSIAAYLMRQADFRCMGTTLVAALIQGDCATVIYVGDSRAYRFDGEAMHQISEDHSYVEEMRRRG